MNRKLHSKMSETRVLSVANSKGGVGKSTVTILLATALAKQKKKKVLIIDTDSQKSIAKWLLAEKEDYDTASLVNVEAMPPMHVHSFLEKFGEDYDIIFIDVPRMTDGMNETANVQLLYFCDSILIPVLGTRLDVSSTVDFYRIAQDAETIRKKNDMNCQVFGFINKENQRKDNQEAKAILSEQVGMNMLDATLRDLKLFTTPSLFESLLDSAEGRKRFEPFFKEVVKKLKL